MKYKKKTISERLTEQITDGLKLLIAEDREKLGSFLMFDEKLNSPEHFQLQTFFRRCGRVLTSQMHSFNNLDEALQNDAWRYVALIYENMAKKIQPTKQYFEDGDKVKLIESYKEIDLKLYETAKFFPEKLQEYRDLLNEEYQLILFGKLLKEKAFII